MHDARAGARIDETMERASEALAGTDYFKAESLCLRALDMAHRAADFERMARICLPLQEAWRQKRLMAIDSGRVFVISRPEDVPRRLEAGRYLVQPPMIGADARALREVADRQRVAALVLCREPATRAGQWPIVAVGPQTIRAKVPPPADATAPDAAWFEAAAEALGDAAIERLKPDDPPHWRVEDLLEFLDAHPDHEKLHQRLEEACRSAIGAAEPAGRRRRNVVDDPFGF